MGDSPFGSSICGFHFLHMGVIEPWYNTNYLHTHKSEENNHVGYFPSLLQCTFGYLLDKDSTGGLEHREIGSGFRGWLEILDSLNSLYRGL